jgi:uncharacterized membrane protein YhiD involved in acid resistance
MLNFEKYLSDFNSTIDIKEFLLNLILITLLTYGLKLFYIKFGRAISDRARFSNNFIPLALATLLIITVIKSSIALSLGLVGALSIVRFRAAIKDPEELTMLFLVIGFGLIGGANKPILALVSFIFILPMLYLNNRMASERLIAKNKTYLNINTSLTDVDTITKTIADDLSYVELRRADTSATGVFASYLCKIDNTSQFDNISKKLKSMDNDVKISMIDQPEVLS